MNIYIYLYVYNIYLYIFSYNYVYHFVGTTDCLGHVALITDFMATLAEQKPKLKTTITVVFIANEENSDFRGM